MNNPTAKLRNPNWRKIWCGGFLAGLAMITPAGAEATALSEETYAAIQTAFLQEEFEKVVGLVQPLVAKSSVTALSGLAIPEQARKTTQVWLWYALSLERLQRTSDALREIDRLKAILSDPALLGRSAGEDDRQKGGAGASLTDPKRLWPEVLFWEGEISRKALQMVRARVAYQRLLTNFPDSSWRPQAQLGLGLVLFHQQAYDAASLQFRDVVMTFPTSPAAREALVLEGVCDIRLQRFHKAVARFRQLLEQPLDQSLRAQVAFCLGEALTGLHQFEEASQAYQQAIDAKPDSPWAHVAHFGLGWSSFQQHRCRESLQAFRTYLTRDPVESRAVLSSALPDTAQAELLFAQGHCLMELGDDAKALARFEELRRRRPDHPLAIDATLSMAQLLEDAQRLTEAMAVLESVFRLTLEPTQRKQAHLRLGSVYLAQGQAMKAIAQFHLAKETKAPELRQAALNGLGDAQMALGNAEAAAQWYDEAIRITPNTLGSLYATYQLGRLKLSAGQVSEAVTLFRRLVNQSGSPLAADARLALAFAYLSNSQNDLARVELEHVRAQGPTTPQAARADYYLALLALHEGNMAEATRLCEEVIRQVPQSDEALEARLLLIDLVASQSSPQEALAAFSKGFGSLNTAPPRHRGKLAKKLGDLARTSSDYAQAIHWYEVAWQDLPAHRGELDYRIASCYEEGGDLEVAGHRYRAIAQTPWQVRGQLAAAKLMEREQQWQEAIMLYESITHQPVPEAKIAQERLAALSGEHLARKR